MQARLQWHLQMVTAAHVQFDPFSCAEFLSGFRNFHLLLIAYRSRASTDSGQNHRDFACPACVTKPSNVVIVDNRCLLLSSILISRSDRTFAFYTRTIRNVLFFHGEL